MRPESRDALLTVIAKAQGRAHQHARRGASFLYGGDRRDPREAPRLRSAILQSSGAFMISRCAINCVIVGAGLFHMKSSARVALIRQ
jgi:hypothetical protein